MTFRTRLPFDRKYARGSSLSLGMALEGKIPRSKTCVELGSRIPAACRFQLRFIQHRPGPRPLTGPWPILKRYVVDPACRQSMRSELAVLGITESVAFPDIDGLANELAERFS
jgi:hypothetical protein